MESRGEEERKGKEGRKDERKMKNRERKEIWEISDDCDSSFSHFRIGIFTLTPFGLNKVLFCPQRVFLPHKQDLALLCINSYIKEIEAIFPPRT